MMNEEKLLAVARYLEGDMELQEKLDFEAALQADDELQGLVAKYNDVHQSLKMKIAPDESDRELAATLSALNRQYFKNGGSTAKAPGAKVISLSQYMKWVSVAAVLIIGLFVWAPWSESLYDQYAISKKMSVTERGAGQQNSLEKAASLYNSKNYSGAAGILGKEHAAKPGNSLIAYYYGVSLIETNQFEKGRTVLLKLYQEASVFKYDAGYYIALSYVKQHNKNEAKTWLLNIPEGTANYNKAHELVEKL